MEPIFELALDLPDKGSRERLRSLHRQLRDAILDGRLQPGLRLPPTRVLASRYGVSRNTAVAVYDLLLSEGYLSTRRGSGTYVADVIPKPADRKSVVIPPANDHRLAAYWREPPVTAPVQGISRHTFRIGVPDITKFPFDVWRRLSTRALRGLAKSPAVPSDPQGRPTLREAIAKHASFTRAVACDPEDIVVTAGAQEAFGLLARILVTPGKTVVAVENPGYRRLRAAFMAAGARLVPVPVDAEGLVVEQVPAKARVICVTPSHQFPLGTAMSMRRRAALLELARARGAVVIEDDYDAEFRYGGRPLDALQTLDRAESVFYVGTFSKSLFPDLRLGFVVIPAWARRAFVAAKHCSDGQCPQLSQDTLAAFIAEGHLARHVRKMRQVYDERRHVLLDGLQRDFRRWLDPIPSAAGLHLCALTRSSVDADDLVERATKNGIGLYPLRWFEMAHTGRPGLVFGYGTIEKRAVSEALWRLRRVWR